MELSELNKTYIILCLCAVSVFVQSMCPFKHKYDYQVAPELYYSTNTQVTTDNNYRLLKYRNHYDPRKFTFTNRIVNIWNSLPNTVVDVASLDLFNF